MDITELLREVLRTVRSNALRSFLTLLGVIIGVATLVAVVAVISGLNAYVRDKVFALSPDVFVISKFGILRSREEFIAAVKRPNFDRRDFERIAPLLKRARQVGAKLSGTMVVKYGGHRLADVETQGTTANYGGMMNLDLATGRYFLDSEAIAGAPVAVIGWDVKEELFPQLDPLGRVVLVGGSPYRVIGLIAKQGNMLGQTRDNQLYLPLASFAKNFGSRTTLDIFVQARGGVAGLDDAADEARAVVRALRHTPFHSPDPFGVVTAESLQTLWGQISAAAFILTLLIASVSLGVGGVVIMNIMLVSVAERTQEIGLRRALGARQRDIGRQFLLEAAMLSLGGGLVGALLGSLLALAINGLLHFPARPSLGLLLLGLALSAAVGLAAGYLPARSASRLAVVDALRAE
ncbi:MAG TPA: ABC transporter permease [Thermoanaerobaculia bacterium]|jgi:putative ABC transport system permease protein|nr:ABC transporter permease [Thermoanaerobaculia bacterium]